jgi:hypothetical protein
VDWLTREPPSEVDVCGEMVPIRSGWRHAVRSYSASGQAAVPALLASWFSVGSVIDQTASAHPDEAVTAAISWRDAAFSEAMPYGNGGVSRAGGKPTFDLLADSAIVSVDFWRIYRIDLRTAQMHWWLFAALLSALMRTDGSLVMEAASARSPIPRSIEGDARRDAERRAEAWALPLPEPELVRRRNERVREEW